MFFRILLILFSCLFVLPLHAKDKTLLILGDSLSAAYGIPLESGWVSLLEQRLVDQGYAFNVINASISGETTLGARTRLTTILKSNPPDLAIVELGGNDGLRGFPFTEIEQNLSAIVQKLSQRDCLVLLVPIQLPPNYGQAYNQKFRGIYDRIATQYDIQLSEFILKDIAINKDLMQADGIHPVEEAQTMMLENIWPDLQQLIQNKLALQ